MKLRNSKLQGKPKVDDCISENMVVDVAGDSDDSFGEPIRNKSLKPKPKPRSKVKPTKKDFFDLGKESDGPRYSEISSPQAIDIIEAVERKRARSLTPPPILQITRVIESSSVSPDYVEDEFKEIELQSRCFSTRIRDDAILEDEKISVKVTHIVRPDEPKIKSSRAEIFKRKPLLELVKQVALERGCEREEVVLVYNQVELFSFASAQSAGLDNKNQLYSYHRSYWTETNIKSAAESYQRRNLISSEDAAFVVEDTSVEEETVFFIRIRFSIDQEPKKLKVTLNETINDIITRAAKWNNGVLIKLVLDGEVLAKDSTLQDYDVESGDLLEIK